MKQETFTRPPDGDRSHGWAILAVCFALVAMAVISTVTRVWIRARVTRNLGWDDHLISIATVTTVIGNGLITAGVLSGLGRHEYYLTPSQRQNVEAIGWADFVQLFITCLLIKISICLFLLRIVNSKRVKQAIHAFMAAMVLFTMVSVFLFLGVCRPLRAHWTVNVKGVCFTKRVTMNIVVAHGVLSVISDLICASLPALFLRNLQISKKTKVGLGILMGAGVITAVCCLVRTALSGALLAKDASWDLTTNVAWRIPEVNIGIICANAPILRPLYLFFTGKLSTKKSYTTGVSKERVWPSNAKRSPIPDSSKWPHGSDDTATGGMSMEMGLPLRGGDEEEGPLK